MQATRGQVHRGRDTAGSERGVVEVRLDVGADLVAAGDGNGGAFGCHGMDARKGAGGQVQDGLAETRRQEGFIAGAPLLPEVT